jgi:phosphomannomutase
LNKIIKFGTSGIRGVFQDEIDVNLVNKLVESIVLGKLGSKFLIGHDVRKSAILLANVLSSGLSYYGKSVNQIGFAPTPVIAYATKNGDYDFGFAVTASHNPPDYCGIKIFDSKGVALSEETESMLQEYNSDYKYQSRKFGKIAYNESTKIDYKLKLLDLFSPAKKKYKILVDCANGVTNNYTPEILSRLGHSVVSINSHQSYLFQGHSPEPIAENLGKTVAMVKNSDMDFGFVHDGDGDRLVIITKQGIVPDYVFSYLLLSIILKERKGDVVISINSSVSLEDLAKENNCNVTRTRLGKTFILLDKISGVYATEPSKVIDAKWGLWEDGIYSAIKLVDYMSSNNLELDDLLKSVPKKHYIQKNILSEGFNFENLKERALEEFGKPKELEEIDGLRLVFEDEWVLFRASGTEPKCRIYVESNDQNKSLELLKKAESVLS